MPVAVRSPSDVPPPGEAGPPTLVGIGASAGGLKALKDFFEHVDPASGLAYVVVVHLAPERESRLAEILQPHTALPVTQVTEATRIEPDHVYVIPPGRNLDAVDTHLRLSALEAERGLRAPIDHFFRTLAGAPEARPVAVVLTGTGSDGTLGLREVKLKAGLTIAQDPNEAEFDGMPQSAIATGLVDLVLPIPDIPDAILRFVRTEPRLPVPSDDDLAEAAGDAERRALRRLFAHLRARTGRDFSRYKRSTIVRRVTRRMRMAHVEELGAYLDVLHERPAEALALADDLLITVTHFFRDAEVFEGLAADAIPELVARAGPEGTVRAWSVGCATGEEAYSLAILLLEACARLEAPPRIQVFATDLHEASLRRAREGLYLGDIEADVSAGRLARFFQREAGGYRIRKEVRDLIVFAPHNLLGDPPFSKLDLVTCRNVLIYLQREVQRDVIELFHYALRPEGVLVLGTSETIESPELFRVVDKKRCLYRKRNVPAQEPRLPVFPRSPGRRVAQALPADPVPFRDLHQRLLDETAPPSLLLGPDDRVAHVSATAGRFLEVPGGELTASAFRLVREELRVELRAALLAARHRGGAAQSEPVAVELDGEARAVVLDVLPAPGPEADGFALVRFIESPAPQWPPASGADTRLTALEAELTLTRRRLQSVLDEDEHGREALKASNEELQSANEELRSTMEELETSKEELQSMNEELQTVNQENQHRVVELAQLTGDLQNLLAATEIATLFLDRDFHILRFTPPVARLFNVRPADRGRPLTDLTHRLGENALAADAAEVLRTLTPVERELQDEAGRWYLTRVLPYRSADDRIEGVVITFVDLSARKAAEEALRRSEERLRELSDAVPDVLFTLDDDGLVDSMSSQIETLAGVAPASLVGTRMWPVLVHPDDREAAQAAWAAVADGSGPFEARYRVLRTDGGACWVIARARPADGPDGGRRWFGTLTEIDALTRAEAGLRELNATLEERVQARTAEVRQLAAQLTVAEQKERQRIAYVLHEDLQQVLTGAQIAAALGGGDTLRDLLDRALRITRTLSHELSPPLLQGEGLAELLEWVVTRKRDLYGLTVELDIPDRVSLPETHLRVLVYQTLRELLFNVAKHAGTDEARILVTSTPEAVRIAVEDDGAGFDPDSEGAIGLGLASVRERVELVGGRFEIHASRGEGTRVAFDLPSPPKAG